MQLSYDRAMPLRLALADDLAPLGVALGAGGTAVIPTDTVYGLVCAAAQEAACAELSRLKGRDPRQPSSVLVATLEAAEQLTGGDERRLALLATGATVIMPNRERRYAWLCGLTPDRIGVRLSRFAPGLEMVLAAVGPLLATSANVHGGPDPATLAAVPPAIADRVDVLVDGARVEGIPSTVLDLTGPRPVILRAGRQGPHTLKELLDA